MDIHKKMRIRPSKGPAYWVEKIEIYERSEGSQREFCQRHNLAVSTFTNWLRKIRSEKKKPVSKFRLLESVEGGLFEGKQSSIHTPVLVEGRSAWYEVTFKNGVCLKIPGTHSLKALITALA
jgi:hypothetical protein